MLIQSRLLIIFFCAVFNFSWCIAGTSEVNAQIALLTEKADLCILSKDGNSKYCKEFDSFKEFIFKDSAQVWAQYHIDNNNINRSNEAKVMKMFDRIKLATALVIQAMK